ncbi:2-oxoglutarate dehydrogenase complex dihydrolipoyllysine-residue succinyltransferase [Magnetovibrio blakemorei]|uniref:Dihydrolipoyllysine-residue succinyltransferase component of 2-oxoglutarate dehydrogenase complex n=1 Tax=Magnetovibrio blakemorei TaxID=28181 RepID=A0A1E5QAW0_9PROT|nr:2-oxoglutarate dehydrogenase complex dihydrolipoyllysine-residue succinyltransferase [Magnetovibrio blakemorei]OEJ69158.1 dihydrolipoamide succinyltransferase [Magnetovibrio blakemorei]
MTVEIKVPVLGESVSEATVAKWFKQPGDAVDLDEPIVELETDKVTVEVPSPAAGVLKAIAFEDGQDVGVGAVLGTIDDKAVAASAPSAAAAPAPAAAAAPAVSAEDALSPAVKKLIDENHLDASTIVGSGKDGRIVKGDVLAHLENKAATPAPASASASAPAAAPKASAATAPTAAQYPPRPIGPREERVPMTRLRKRIAERLKEAQNTAAMLTTFNEVDMTNVMDLRKRFKDGFEKKHGVKLGFMSFFTKAVVTALRELPAVNAEINDGDIIFKNHYDIGVAVGTENGLVVPVVRDCDSLGFAQIEQSINDFGRRAREGRLTMDEMSGGTFTITNGGIFGSLLSTPILNPPQSGILGMHKIQMRPMVMPDGSIEARPMMYLALSYDHRIVDGREAVTFLVRVKECIEDPDRIMLDA